jgi:hypothetical protein
MGAWLARAIEVINDPFILIGLWVVLAFVMAAFPSTDNHWRRAYVLMAIGAPLLIWITWQHGIWFGILGVIVGASVFRWPVYFLWRWIKQRLAR